MPRVPLNSAVRSLLQHSDGFRREFAIGCVSEPFACRNNSNPPYRVFKHVSGCRLINKRYRSSRTVCHSLQCQRSNMAVERDDPYRGFVGVLLCLFVGHFVSPSVAGPRLTSTFGVSNAAVHLSSSSHHVLQHSPPFASSAHDHATSFGGIGAVVRASHSLGNPSCVHMSLPQ